MPTPTDDPTTPPGRTFLCVVDKSEEFGKALRFACRRCVCVTVNQRRVSESSSSRRGQRTKCQWFGITQYESIRVPYR